MDSLFILFLTNPSYGHSGRQWIHSKHSKMMTHTHQALLCWGRVFNVRWLSSLCSCLVWPLLLISDIPLTTTHASMHLPSLVSAGTIFCLSFSKVALPVLYSQQLARLHCSPYSMLMGLTDVLQGMVEKGVYFVVMGTWQGMCPFWGALHPSAWVFVSMTTIPCQHSTIAVVWLTSIAPSAFYYCICLTLFFHKHQLKDACRKTLFGRACYLSIWQL